MSSSTSADGLALALRDLPQALPLVPPIRRVGRLLDGDRIQRPVIERGHQVRPAVGVGELLQPFLWWQLHDLHPARHPEQDHGLVLQPDGEVEVPRRDLSVDTRPGLRKAAEHRRVLRDSVGEGGLEGDGHVGPARDLREVLFLVHSGDVHHLPNWSAAPSA